MPSSSSIQAGAVLSGKYRVGRELGRGGMASVFAADNIDIGKRVAIKLLAGHLAASQTVVERFLREARAVAKIRSPHICDVYDVGRLDDGTPFLVLELLEGESLYDAMVRDRQMSPPLTLAIILQLCRGLAKAHEVGIVHRDLKPENVFLTVDDDGNLLVKILDFGLAKFYDSPADGADEGPPSKRGARPRLTRDGAVFGTPAYMSPEQVRGQAAADTRADLWAVACVAYECFTGTTVWKTDEGVAMTFAQIATAPIPDPRAYRPDLPTRFTAWFQKALDRTIERRFQSVQEFADELVAAFDYKSKSGAGGLDPSLINQLTRAARTVSDLDAPTVLVPRRQLLRERDEQPVPLVRHSLPAPEPTARELSERPAPPRVAPARVAPSPAAATPVAAPEGAPSKPPGSAVPTPLVAHHPTFVHLEEHRASRRKAVGVGVALSAIVVVLGAVALGGEEAPKIESARRFADDVVRVAAAPSGSTQPAAFAPTHPWYPKVREAQALVAKGEHDRAVSLLRKVADEVKHGLPKNLLEQAMVAATAKRSGARCQVTGLGRPRTYDVLQPDRRSVGAGAPAIARGLGGAVVTWSDSSEGSERLSAVALDDALRVTAAPGVVTPDGNKIGAPRLLPVAQRFVVAYPDSVGVPGVYSRWLGPAAAPAGDATLVSAPKTTATDLDAARTPDGGVVVAWAEEREGSTAVALRVYDKDGQPRGKPVRIAEQRGTAAPRLGDVRVDVRGERVHVVYTTSKLGTQEVRHQAVPLDAAAPGIEPTAPGGHALTREQVLSRADEAAVEPALACGNEGCFVAWHEPVRGGGSLALVERTTGKVQWTKRVGAGGRRFALAVAPNGQGQVAWFEGGKLVLASLGVDGASSESRVAKATGEPPAVSLAPGAQRGEWYAAWLDSEGIRAEPYVLRAFCP